MAVEREETSSQGDRLVLAPNGPRRAAHIVRWAVLSTVLAAMTTLGVLHQQAGIGRPVGVDALCPFGGLESMWSLVSNGTLVRRAALSSVLLLGTTIAVALMFRRAFCGRVCPLGFLQELSGRVGRLTFGRRRSVPVAIDKSARFLKYVVLAVSLALAWTTADLVIRPYDPWVAYQHLASPELITELGIGFVVLVISLVGSLLYDRFFCKYACPMGAFLATISRFSIFKVRRIADTCIDCKACDRACPMNVAVSETTTVADPECIDCGECVAACPVADTLAFGSAKRSLAPVTTGVLSVSMFAVIIAGATAAGAFDWSQPTLKQQMQRGASISGGSSRPGTFDVSLIKGSTTIVEIVEAVGVPAEAFTAIYGIPASEQGRPLKELKDVYGCYPGDVRTFVELYLTDPTAAASYVPGSGGIEGH